MKPIDAQPRSGVTGATKVETYSHRKAVKGGVSLHPAVRKMADTRKSEENYRSLAAYYCGRKHWLTAQLMHEPIDIQEKVFAELLEHRKEQSTWFEHRIEEIVKERDVSSGSTK
jgi:CRISPR/Cas system-associated protein Cas10 (large subunit of type III CRISPR-Cas system)